MSNLGSRGFLPFHQRPVNVCPAILYMSHVSLLFEDTNGRKYRVISQLRLLWKSAQHLLNARWALLPQHVHKPEFSFGQSRGFRGRQETILRSLFVGPNLLDAKEAQTSTNYLVACRGVFGCLGALPEIDPLISKFEWELLLFV